MASELKPCPACGKRVDGVHTCNPQLRVSPALLRVADACERMVQECKLNAEFDDYTDEFRETNRVDGNTLAAHARAIREGKIQEVGT